MKSSEKIERAHYDVKKANRIILQSFYDVKSTFLFLMNKV